MPDGQADFRPVGKLEDRLDQTGPDDVAINAEKFIELLGCGEDGGECCGAEAELRAAELSFDKGAHGS